MAKPNYAFAKRQRDLAKKQKKELKKQRKQEQQAQAGESPPEGTAVEDNLQKTEAEG